MGSTGLDTGFWTMGQWSLSILVIILTGIVYLDERFEDWHTPPGVMVGTFEYTYYVPAFYFVLVLAIFLSIMPGLLLTGYNRWFKDGLCQKGGQLDHISQLYALAYHDDKARAKHHRKDACCGPPMQICGHEF